MYVCMYVTIRYGTGYVLRSMDVGTYVRSSRQASHDNGLSVSLSKNHFTLLILRVKIRRILERNCWGVPRSSGPLPSSPGAPVVSLISTVGITATV